MLRSGILALVWGGCWAVSTVSAAEDSLHPAQLKVDGAVMDVSFASGKLDLPEILAVSRGQPNRLDLPLTPGYNKFVIVDENGHFIAHRDENAQPPQPIKQ